MVADYGNPQTTEEVAESIRSKNRVSITAWGAFSNFALPAFPKFKAEDFVCTELLYETIEFEPNDQVLVVGAGANLGNLNFELKQYGQCIPQAVEDFGWWAGGVGSIGSLISMNLPHVFCSTHGSWKDWVLGLKVVLADGTIVKCGSHAVKNVAGYDLHKFFVGARGTLGVITEAVLRTTPLRSISTPTAKRFQEEAPDAPMWIQRTMPADFQYATERAGSYLSVSDPASSTLWAVVPPDQELERFPGDWVIRSGCGEKNVQITDPTQIRLMKRAKEIFDPTNKLNPGEWGFM